jgi:hypothetical protein
MRFHLYFRPFGWLILGVFWLCFLSLPLSAQTHTCITDHIHQQKITQDTAYLHRYQAQQSGIYQRISQLLKDRHDKPTVFAKTAALYTIPVVIHIIHDNGTENISDAQVQQGMKDLNDAFRYEAPYNGAKGVDIEIEFCLAKQDPFGNATTGINRVVSTLTNHNSTGDLALKNLSRWDPTQYLNIWLVREICMPSYGCGVAGYAYYASAHGTSFDGIVNEARWFGSSQNNSKIHIHEVGHYLNLAHTFDAGCPNTNCLLNGDRVCDTPPDDSKAGVACSSSANSCTTDEDDVSINNPFRPIALGGLGDQPDMHENYMDYSFQSCQNALTQGQKDRMTDALLNLRMSLLASNGCQIPCPVAIDADFTVSPALTVNVGTLVNFFNTSSNATNYEWLIDGVSQATSTDYAHTFGTAGTFSIKLIARNPVLSLSCVVDTTIQLNVVCPALTVGFTTGTNPIVAGTSTTLTNTSSAGTFEWFVNGISQATTTDYTFSSTVQGNYIIRLEATETGCKYSFRDTIAVTCPVQAFFTVSSADIFTSGTVSFTNTSLNASSYEWFIDNISQGITTDFNPSFPMAGDYIVKLVATNGICKDSIAQVVNVSDPGSCAVRNADIWYFGNQAGLSFTSGTPTPLYDSQMFAQEGCSSISNQFGDLLFYTNGINVWDRNHILMPNGSGLLGGFSSTQSVQIIPKPGSSSTYYIFTTDDEGGADGLRYSEVEMSLNGGFGDVVVAAKNIALHTPVAEKLTALIHANGCDVWLIAHGWNNDEFLAYHISSAGVNTTPEVSNAGTAFGFTGLQSTEAGQMKASPDGKKLAMAIRNAAVSPNTKSDAFEIYDFNTATGAVTNAQTLAAGMSTVAGELLAPYGVEFSPDNSKVYVSSEFRGIYQYDLQAGSLTDIINSQTLITSAGTGQQSFYYALQLAPDSKIYVATNTDYLGVIASPNALGLSSDYNATGGLYVGNPDCDNPAPECAKSNKGLPPFIPNHFNQLDFLYQCNGLELSFTLNTTLTDIDNIVWEFGDPASGTHNYSNQTNPTHDYTSTGAGTYLVKMMAKDGCICTQVIKPVLVNAVCNVLLAPTGFSFKAQAQTPQVKLIWTVGNPLQWAAYILERSEDGQNFETLRLFSTMGSQQNFEYWDDWQAATKLYYRLRLIENTGRFVYSSVQKVEREVAKIRLYPVPIQQGEDFQIQFPPETNDMEVKILFLDILGKVVLQRDARILTSSCLHFTENSLSKGIYQIVVQSNKEIQTLRLVVY